MDSAGVLLAQLRGLCWFSCKLLAQQEVMDLVINFQLCWLSWESVGSAGSYWLSWKLVTELGHCRASSDGYHPLKNSNKDLFLEFSVLCRRKMVSELHCISYWPCWWSTRAIWRQRAFSWSANTFTTSPAECFNHVTLSPRSREQPFSGELLFPYIHSWSQANHELSRRRLDFISCPPVVTVSRWQLPVEERELSGHGTAEWSCLWILTDTLIQYNTNQIYNARKVTPKCESEARIVSHQMNSN